ncbi:MULTISPECIES: hypothetical protein [unclassified Xanthobacter]|uniref:hypothetical protein n=1 Tax=unclassified Xanthobacter TaxID=2623496 RepID=UPI001F2D728F|nr:MULTISPECIES: hypothetical protein [unclassified Xanthobacter]
MKRSIAVALLLAGLVAAPAGAEEAEDCLVTQAADAAVQRQIHMIDAAKVNPAQFFSGSGSCISAALMGSFDLSNLIPDLAGLVYSGVTSAITSAIASAQQQVCSALNSQMSELISNINSTNTCFTSGLSAKLAAILGTSSSIKTSSSCGSFGTYSLTGSSRSYSNVLGLSAAPASGSTAATVATGSSSSSAATSTTASTTGSSTSFGSILFGN